MLLQILASTPTWVFVLFVVLLGFGVRQAWSYRASLVRVAILPVTMKTLAVVGVISAFGPSSMAVAAWALAALLAVFVVLRRPLPATTRYDVATRSFAVTGSVVPLALLMGIFFTKYVVAVQLAMHPALSHDADFALVAGTLYGAFSGVFAARAIRLWKLALRSSSSTVGGASTLAVAA